MKEVIDLHNFKITNNPTSDKENRKVNDRDRQKKSDRGREKAYNKY